MAFALIHQLDDHREIHERDKQREMAPMEDHHLLETHHTIQWWET